MLEISQCKSMTQVSLCLLPWAMSLVKKFAKMENCVGNHTWLVHQTSPTWLTGANPLLWIWVTFIHYTARIIINICPVTWGKIKSINYSKQCVFYGKVYKISAQVLNREKDVGPAILLGPTQIRLVNIFYTTCKSQNSETQLFWPKFQPPSCHYIFQL